MFVPKGALSAGSLRNTRRRQRTSSDESIKPPKAKRQRSVLRQENSELSSDSQPDIHLGPSEIPTSVISDELDFQNTDKAGFQKQLPIRALKKSEKRENEVDGTVVLSKTDFYTVSQLPTLPDQIRGLQSEPFRCVFGTGHGYALALTNSHAIIWPYSTSTSSPSPADVFTLAIPESCKESNGALPLGVLLSTATGGMPGLMVIMPYTGKIIYWETVLSAASLGLPRQKQTGLQGYISGLLSGEHVTDVVNGEPSGVIVTFSSGRVAHITFRDSQGKPTVMVSFLRNSSSSGRVGFFDGIKNVLGGGFWRKDVAAVKAGESHQRGQRDIIIATSTGLFEIWDTHWNNGSMLKKQFDIRQELCTSLGWQTDSAGDQDLRVLDFAFMAKENNAHDLQNNGAESWPITLVVAPPQSVPSKGISVVQIVLSEEVHVLTTSSIDLQGIPTNLVDSQLKPKLFVPKPGNTAFIVVCQSLILLSLTPFEESPTSQLLIDSNRLPQPFRDSITFRSGTEHEIIGSGFEDQASEESFPACLVMVRDFGVIRITALPRHGAEKEIEDAQITAKHKIEQAVFYGTMLGNPLNLASQGGLDFPLKEIEQAALEICRELLRSASKFLPTTAISLDQNLRLRAKALDDLASLLLQQNQPLDRQAWWELLWSAEKLAAQRAMWKIEDSARRSKGQGPTFLAHIIELMSEKFKTRPEQQTGESDHVRDWFLYDTFRMEHIVPWIFNAIKPKKGSSARQGRSMSEQILQASELSLAVLETAFRYRDEHAHQYGLNDGYLEDGILTAGYAGLPEFWTSQSISYIETVHLLDLELDSCRAWIQQTTSTVEAPENQIVRKISGNSARQLRVLGLMHCERVQWLSAQEDPKLVDEGIALEQAHIKQRKWQLFKLAGIGQLEAAIGLAEKFRDMGALVELIIELQDQTKTQDLQTSHSDDASDVENCESEQLSRKISLYFEKFGESWADAFFSRQISMGQSGILFTMRKFQPFITRFLHKDPAYLRLCWINDVIGENDYDAAARSLETLAIEHESDIWSHRVGLALSKLSKLAAWEETNAPSNSALHSDIKRLEDYAEIDAVQEVVYASIAPALQGAIDQKAEIDLAIDQFGKHIAEDRPSLHEMFCYALTKVVTRQVIEIEQLVDLLTLIDVRQISEYTQNEFIGKEFYLALRVIRLSPSAQRDPLYHVALQKLVWRRCMIRDNWEATGKEIENMGNESEAMLYDTALFRTFSLCLSDKQPGDSNVSPLYMPTSPVDALLSESDSELISSRFPLAQRNRIIRDLQRESELLRQHVEGGKLDFWFKNLLASADEIAASSVTATANAIEQTNNEVSEETPNTKAQLSWL